MERSVDDRDARVTELLDAYLAAERAGRPLGREAFLAAHADVRNELAAALRALAFVGLAAQDLAEDGASEPPPPPVGTLGDFRLIREVGRGGMGVVYEAEQISLARRVAVKVLPFASVLDPRQLQRFRHEAQAAALLHHTNIVPVHAVGTERGVHYYAMEFVEGRTLAAVIHELRAARRPGSAERARARRPSPRAAPANPISSAEVRALTESGSNETPQYCRAVARLGVQAAEALEHAHEHGVVHRDVKPANLMVDARGHLWIADFGLARSRANTQLTLTGGIVGTLGYMSPEQALGRHGLVDHRADVYSLGVTLLEALTLEPAFTGDDPQQVIQDIAHKAPIAPRKRNEAVPQALETILLKAVAKDPESRYPTAQEMADDLRRYLADEPVRARRTPVLDRVSLWTRRHRAAVAAAGCVLVVAVVALAADAVRVGVEKRRAEDALAQAKDNLAKARDAVDRMLTQVGSEKLAGIPGLEPVRRKLLEDAVVLYDGMLASADADDAVRLDAARAFHRMGGICRQLGDRPAAELFCDRARSLLVTLAPEDGPANAAAAELAAVEMLRANMLFETSRAADAVPVFEHAAALAERAVRERPEDADAGRRLAVILQDQGHALSRMGRHADADAAARRAVKVQEAVIARAPDDRRLNQELATRLSVLAEVAASAGREAEAEDLLHRAILESVSAADEPSDSEAFTRRAEIHAMLADRLLETGQVAEALPLLRIAAEARGRAAAEFPRFPAKLVAAADAEGCLAAVLFQTGHADEATTVLAGALARWDRLRDELRDFPDLRAVAADDLAILGDHLARAGREADADAAFRRAVVLHREAVLAAPGRAYPRMRLAETISRWAGTLAERLAEDERLSLCLEAVKAAEESTSRPDAVLECRETHAQALGVLADTLTGRGDVDGAADAYRRAVEIGLDLVARSPDAPGRKRDVAVNRRNWAQCLKDAGRLDEAASQLRQALATFEAPDTRELVDDDLADTVAVLSDVERARGRFPEAEVAARRALELGDQLVARFPQEVRRQSQRAGSRRKLAEALRDADRPEDAEREWLAARDELRDIVRRNPGDLLTKSDLADCCSIHSLGGFFSATGRAADALECLEETVQVRAELAVLEPSRERRDTLLQVRTDRIHVLARVRPGDAERELRASIDLCEEFGREVHRMRLADAWATLGSLCDRTGRPREAVTAFERALEALPYRKDAFASLVVEFGDGPEEIRDTRRAVEMARAGLELPKVDRALLWSVPSPWQCFYDVVPNAAWNLLGCALVCDGQWKDGLAACAKARELGYEQDGTDWIYEALAEAKLGDWKAARESCDRAEAWFAGNPQPHERFARRRAEVAALLVSAPPR